VIGPSKHVFDWLADQQDGIGQLRNYLGKIPNQAGDDEPTNPVRTITWSSNAAIL
jgi:hypothetical protein